MARFVFAFEALLTARRHAEQARQRVVAELEAERATLEDAIRRHQHFIADGKSALRGELGPSPGAAIDLTALRSHAGVTIHLMRQAQRHVLDLAGVHKRLEVARAELAEAARMRRAVELLRERRFEEWRRRLERAENALADEVGIQQQRRKDAS